MFSRWQKAVVGWEYRSGKFSPPASPEPAPPTLSQVKAAQLAVINRAYSEAVHVLAADYPEDEQKSWPVQIMEARALQADPGAETPWIDAAARDRGVAREVLAQLIIAQDGAYRVIHGGLSGTRQRLRDAIDNAETVEDVWAVRWPEEQS